MSNNLCFAAGNPEPHPLAGALPSSAPAATFHNMNLYVGIDPGASGGVASIREDGSLFRVDKLPPTIPETFALFQALENGNQVFAILENVGVWKGSPMGKNSAFTFGRNFGNLEALLHAAGISYDLIQASRWQGFMSCLSRGNKNITKKRAQQLFPKLTITHAIADSLLMAEFCRRLRTGQFPTLPAKARI